MGRKAERHTGDHCMSGGVKNLEDSVAAASNVKDRSTSRIQRRDYGHWICETVQRPGLYA
jgi:hypothetical protein